MLMLAGGFAYFAVCDLAFRVLRWAARKRPVVTYGPGSARAYRLAPAEARDSSAC